MRRSTWIVLLIFLVLVALIIYLDQREAPPEEVENTPEAPVEFLFSDTDGLPTGIDIRTSSGSRVAVARDKSGAWALIQPIEAEADQAASEAAASQLAAVRVLSELELDPADTGLDPAAYTIDIDFTSGSRRQVRIGDPTPTESGYYAQLDSREVVLILNRDGLSALLNLVDAPPYLNTPVPAFTETPAP